MMELLLDRRRRIPITEEVAKAAAGNESNGKEVMELLLDRRRRIPITEDVVKAAAGNEQTGEELIMLLDKKTSLCLSQGIIDAAAASGQEGVLLYFKQQLGYEISSISFLIARFYNAAKNGDETTIRDLLSNNIPADMKTLKGRSPLWQAARGGHERVVQFLLETPNIDVDVRDENGQTAMLCAVCAWRFSLGTVRLLLTSGANPTLPDKDGCTLFSIAYNSGKCQILKLLRSQNYDNRIEDDNSNTRKQSSHQILLDIEHPSHLKKLIKRAKRMVASLL
jgi:hypothetical protein